MNATSLRILLLVSILATSLASATDLTSSYQWQPVRIGAGGFMRGMAVSPSDSTRRYARGDVDNIYRWDESAQQWYPTKVSSAFPANVTAAPTNAGGGAIAIDPQNPDHVMVVYTLNRSADVVATNPALGLNVYYSTDGAKTFKAGNLSLSGDLSAETSGERLAIDPNNGQVAYLGSPGAAGKPDGLYRTPDGGATWTQVSGSGLPAATSSVRYEFALPRFDGGSGTASNGNVLVSRIQYVIYLSHAETTTNGTVSETITGGGVLRSIDGGVTWTDISRANAQIDFATVDNSGNLWVSDGSANIYKYSRSGTWTTSITPHAGGIGIAVDPSNTQRIFASSSYGGTLARSLDGGITWTDLGGTLDFSETQPIEWLRPSSIRPQGHYISTGGLYIDPSGRLWIPCGNDGVITTTPNDRTDSASNPPVWTSVSEGIEEMVAQSAVIPPGGKPVLSVEDETLFTITNPDTFTAEHYTLNLWNNNNGLSSSQDISYAPNQPLYLAVTTANVFAGNPTLNSSQFAGYSTDGGTTWNRFASLNAGTHPCILYDGLIAVSPRAAGHESDPAGRDNLVWIPTNFNDFSHFAQGPAPFYSKDGGATWTQTQSFNGVGGAVSLSPCGTYSYMGYQWGPWIVSLKQHLLVADPITPGTFYVDLVQGGFWKSSDGGATWTQTQTVANGQIPDKPHHGTVAAVPGKSGDLWMVDGHEGSDQHGLYHSNDGATTWTRSPAFDYAWELALGRAAVGTNYPAIYVYGRQTGNSQWGIFQSIDAGATFNQISYYPYGIIDVPASLTASWDVFGTVYIGFSGNSFYYGHLNSPTPPSDKLVDVNWPASITSTGAASVSVQYSAATSRTVAAYLWDSNYQWKGTVTATVSGTGTVTLSVPDYYSIATPVAFIRVNLTDSSGNILGTVENDAVPVR